MRKEASRREYQEGEGNEGNRKVVGMDGRRMEA